jgi:hypothetical protein
MGHPVRNLLTADALPALRPDTSGPLDSPFGSAQGGLGGAGPRMSSEDNRFDSTAAFETKLAIFLQLR